jgi:PHD/YefM family antitoxin component YafN of YafNO toxin-antitoxin module
MNQLPYTVSVRELQRGYRGVVKLAQRSHEAVVLLNKSKPEAVLLSAETYNDLAANDYLFDEAETLRLVNQARRSHRAGKTKKLKSWGDLDR